VDDNAANISCVSGPSCIEAVTSFDVSGVGAPDANLTGSHSASVRRAVAGFSADSLTFINTGTNAIITSTPWDGLEFGVNGELGAFATSSECFYFPSADGIEVFTKDGVFVTAIAMPGSLTEGSMCNLVYSPEQDLIYGTSFDSGTSTRHFFTVDPNTNTASDSVDIGSASFSVISISPTRVFLAYPNLKIDSYSLPGLALENTLLLNTTVAIPVYAPNAGKLFAPINTFSTPVSFVQIDPATMTIEKTYTTSGINGLLDYWAYNPITGAVFAAGGDTAVMVDPMAESIVCEKLVAPDGVGGIVCDYSSGDDFIWDQDFVDNPMNVFH
jgi:hypothetical protein